MNLSRIPSSFNAHQFPWCGAMPPLRSAPTSRSKAIIAEMRAQDTAHAETLDKRSERRLAKAHALQVEGRVPCLSGELPPLGTSAGRRNAEAAGTLLTTVVGSDNDARRERAAVRLANDILKRLGAPGETLSRQWAAYGVSAKVAHAEAKAILAGFGITVGAGPLFITEQAFKAIMRALNPCTSRAGGRPYKVRWFHPDAALATPKGHKRVSALLPVPSGHTHSYTSDALPTPQTPTQAPLTPKGQTHGQGFGKGYSPLWASARRTERLLALPTLDGSWGSWLVWTPVA